MKLKLLTILFITTIAFISGFGQTHTVINTNDDGSGSLRFIVVNASPGDTIRFSPTINGDTIRLSTGEITLNKNVVIIGNDTTNTIISGENLSRVLRIPLSITVKLVGLTATKGFLDDSDGNFLFGAGIFNEGDLHVLECKIAKNNINGNGITNNYGGGIANEGGNILIEKSTILSNSIMSSSIATSSFSLGGGFYNGKIGSRTAGTGTLISTSIINNSIYGQERVYGGGLVNQGTLKVANSSVKGNVVSAAYESSRAAGGGVSSEGNLEIYNTVISGNLATSADQAFGGGVEYSGGNLTIINSTVAGNSAKGSSGSLVRGGGFYTSSLGRFILKNTIVSQNLSTGSENNLAFGSSVSFTGENNFTQNNIDPFFVTDVPAAPSVLGDLRLQDCSPAINAGTEDTTGLNLGLVDFIGNPRVFDGRIDIGAYELQTEKANPLLVTNATDNKCGSLRVVVANASAGDTIRFAPTINGDTIKLTSGQILIDKNLTIIGNGQDSTIIDTQGLSRIFEVTINATFKIDSLMLQNGDVTPNAAPENLGGAIYVSGRLLVDHSLFQGGKAFAGGAIATDDNTTTDIFIENSTFKNNNSTSLGGAIGFLADTLSIVNSTFSGNSSDFRAGAIRSISANKVIFKNSTFSDNAALSGAGGALSSSNSSSDIEVESCTFYNNAASTGGAFELDNSTLQLKNSILKNTASGSSADFLTFSTPALVEDLGNNLVFSASGTNHTISSGNGIDPLLGMLQNNGGTTETHALLCGSPAYNAGAGTDADQRGEPVFGGQKDIGAFESQSVLDGSVPNIHIVTNTNDDGIGSLRYLVVNACSGDTIRFDNAIDRDTIKLTSGEITIDKNLSIIGNGSENTLIDGQANSRILKTEGRADNLYIAHLTLQNGKVDIAVPFTARDARGGAIYANSSGLIKLDHCVIANNMVACTVVTCSTNVSGGGVYSRGDIEMYDCVISNNQAIGDRGANGGGIYINGAKILLRNTKVLGNSTTSSFKSSQGAGIFLDGEDQSMVFVNSQISGNKSVGTSGSIISEGGGIYINQGDLVLSSVTISGNEASSNGAGVYIKSGDVSATMRNSVIANNTSANGANDIWSGRVIVNEGNNFVKDPNGNHNITDGNGIDPLFVEDVPTTPSFLGDLRLQDCSSLINTGSADTTGLNLGTTDLAGNERVFGGRIDIGAYEFQNLAGAANLLLVTNTNDRGCGSLREAFANASAGDTIRFAPTINGDTIKLTSGQILIDKNLTIIGNGTNSTVIDAEGLSRIFEVATNATFKIDSLTLQNGDVTPNSAPENLGGAIYVSGRLLVDHSLFQGGKAFAGGAIATDDNNTTDIFIENSTFKNNNSTSLGGAIGFLSDTLSIVNSTFSGNSSDFRAGAIRSSTANKLIFKNATFFNNAALSDAGGALSSSNSSSAIEVESCTFFNNSAISGGAFELDNSTLKLQNSILKNTASSSSVDILTFSTPSLVEDLGNNLVFSAAGTNHTISSGNGIDPLLGMLQDNGGTTETHALLCGSPAYNAGAGTDADQRGESVFGGTKDIGAYESQTVLDGSVPNIHIVMNTNDNGIGSLRYLVNIACDGDTIRFDNAIDGDAIKLSTGEITLNKNLVIIGNDTNNTIIDGQNNSRIFHIPTGNTVSLEGIKMQHGNGVGFNSSSSFTLQGGAIFAKGKLVLTFCKLSENAASRGGGVYFDFVNNEESRISNCTISCNSASEGGGGVHSGGFLLISNSMITGNTAENGGGIYNDSFTGNVNVKNSIISGNTAVQNGGGVYLRRSVGFVNCTISGNRARNGGGVYSNEVTISFTNTVVVKNIATLNNLATGPDVRNDDGFIIDGGNNHIMSAAGDHGITDGNGIDPLFVMDVPAAPSVLGNLRLQPCSPLVNAGSADTTGLNLGLVDLAGNPRVLDDRIDIGAYERSAVSLEITNRTLAESNEVFACENGTIKLPAGISSPDFTYQWQVDQGSGFSNLSEATPYSQTNTDSLLISPIALGMDGYQYRALIADACGGSIISDTITLRVGQLPVLVSSPLTQEVCPGNEVILSAEFSGGGFSYQWQVNEGSSFVNVSGSDYTVLTDKLLIRNFDNAKNNNQYQAVATSACFPIPSNAATITINTDVTILAQPSAQTVCEFGTAIFTAQAIKLSAGSISYQWQRKAGTGNWVNINTGGRYVINGNQLQITNAPASWNSAEFRCLMNDYCQTITKTLNVIPVAHITQNPVNREICVGNNANFSVTATGEGLTYRWQVNSGSGFINLTDGGIYQGATSANLNLNFPTAAVNNYQYRCVVSGTSTCDLVADTSGVASISVGVSAEAQTVFYNSSITTDDGITQAVGYILGVNKIQQPNGKAEYRAGNAILLNPGFEVEAGAIFSAKIQNPCQTNTMPVTSENKIPKELVK